MLWLEWKRRVDPQHYLDPKKRGQAWFDAGLQMAREGLIDREHYYGTINCNGVNAKGEVCGVTTTSGLAWKIPGRVGDSPILGAGLYVDGEVRRLHRTGTADAEHRAAVSGVAGLITVWARADFGIVSVLLRESSVTADRQEPLFRQGLEDECAGGGVQPEQSLRLQHRQSKARHLSILSSHTI